jgi:O-antigen ligase
LLPWLLSSTISGRTVFKWRLKWFTVEWLLLIWSAVIVLFTFSRTGLFLLAALALITILLYRFRSSAQARACEDTKPRSKNKRIVQVSVIVLSVAIIGGVIGSQNRYISRFWRYWTEDPPGKKTYLEFIAFQQRFVYWQTAVNIFEEYPLLGVGLGNYAFFFDEMLPDQPYHRQPEIIRQITPVEGRNRLITPKNLYARLLAETGLLGMATFTTFIMAIIGCTLYMLFSDSVFYKFWGISGTLGFVGFLVVIFSYDSFALPNMWVVFGMITAAAHVSDNQQ